MSKFCNGFTIGLFFLNKIIQPNFLYYYDSFITIYSCDDGAYVPHRFFVAAVIKLIAYAADSFDFYSSHRLELLRLRRWRQHRQKVERLVRQIPIADEDALGDFREDYSKGIDRNFTGYSGYYHGVSPGASENNLMNYYYSQDTREFFLREEEQAHVNKKNSKKLTNNKQ